MLKYTCHEISPLIAQLINVCISQGYFSDELKTGCITPIYENGNKNTDSNYRSVCSLSPFNKIIEKVVNNKMTNFIDKYKKKKNSK